MRNLYLAGWTYVVVAGLLLYRAATAPPPPMPIEPPVAMPVEAPVQPQPTPTWFEQMRPHCNPVEVDVAMARTPPPLDWESQAYGAACYALAGKIEKAAHLIDRLSLDQRPAAANVVFEVGHPVADAGDDDAARLIMELVLHYWPENYMARYHAGAAEHNLGDDDRALANLLQFLQDYKIEDGWTESARAMLKELGVEEPRR
jgi:tetratricopeptide (TPR) repeat protein